MKQKSDIYALTVFWVDTYITPLRKSNPELGKIFVHSDNGEFNSLQCASVSVHSAA